YTQTVILLLILTFTGCNKYKEQRQIIDRAENLIESHPDSAYILLRNIQAPDLMNKRLLARWSLLAGKAADKTNEKMPAPFILEKAYNWQKRHGSHENQAWTGLYLARAYTENKKYNDAIKIFTEAFIRQLRQKPITLPDICTATSVTYINILYRQTKRSGSGRKQQNVF
ncbi:MAG: hypothetical protein WCQ87_09220, partial [Parabacteroides sp.]